MTIASTGSGVRLTMHVRPGATRSAITRPHGDAIGVRLAAPPVDGRANEELIRFLAARLRVTLRAITIVHGAASRRKVVDVVGLDAATASVRLQPDAGT